jgi:hypothetical protein
MMPTRPSKELMLALFFLLPLYNKPLQSPPASCLSRACVIIGSWWHGDRCAADVPDLLPDNAWHCPIKKSNGQSPSCHVTACPQLSGPACTVTILHLTYCQRERACCVRRVCWMAMLLQLLCAHIIACIAQMMHDPSAASLGHVACKCEPRRWLRLPCGTQAACRATAPPCLDSQLDPHLHKLLTDRCVCTLSTDAYGGRAWLARP